MSRAQIPIRKIIFTPQCPNKEKLAIKLLSSGRILYKMFSKVLYNIKAVIILTVIGPALPLGGVPKINPEWCLPL